MSTLDPADIARFSDQAADWWNPEGAFRPLHRLNPVRLDYVRNQILGHYAIKSASRMPFKGLKLLDVGCGGGLMAEPLARLGADVTGLDASAATIAIAKAHAASVGVDVTYQTGSVEDLANKPNRYDVITALEIVEHVADVDLFLKALTKLLKPDGLLIMSTLNRTPQSFLLGIVAAEYVLQWVPRGTHNWRQFLRPSELVAGLERQGLQAQNLMGLVFNPLTGQFLLNPQDLSVNYLITARTANTIQPA